MLIKIENMECAIEPHLCACSPRRPQTNVCVQACVLVRACVCVKWRASMQTAREIKTQNFCDCAEIQPFASLQTTLR